MKNKYIGKITFVLLVSCYTMLLHAQPKADPTNRFSTNNKSLTIWNGKQYTPITIKGINLGVAVPGTFPSELNITYAQYYEWFEMMREAGFNTIRLYTLHYPQFYQALRDYNTNNKTSPLLILHGVWLEEELVGYNHDLYYIKDAFTKEIQENISCIHGNKTIAPRLGKAYGTYTADVSEWVLGFIIGREVHPLEVETTNSNHPSQTSFSGTYLSINNVAASEVFVVSMLEETIAYEMTNYNSQRPVSFSSWPTLDPLSHLDETQTDEDKQQIDISSINTTKAPAGVFISYHAYPYYPDFVSKESTYTSYSDYLGQNSYLGYLTNLKSHYPNLPLIIAEFGVPSSWGVAHYAHSGMNHGGFDELSQGETNMRMFNNIIDAECGGGIMFAWIDEWFKRTWITDPMDFLMDRRILWHNITAAEQNFGLFSFIKTDGGYEQWTPPCTTCPIKTIDKDADFTFFKLKLTTDKPFNIDDTLWIGIDTYDATLGESILPNGKTVNNRAEFALMITSYKAELFVTQAYDLYGIWHGISEEEQLYHSIATDGAPWNLVRWKNNQEDQDVQFIGSLKVNRLNLPPSLLDAVTITTNDIEIKLPWTLLNVVDPSSHLVMHDDKNTPTRETIATDGFAVTLFYQSQIIESTTRFKWDAWNQALNTKINAKTSYNIVKNDLPNFAGAILAKNDSYNVTVGEALIVDESNGLLGNDRIFDGGSSMVVISESPKQGLALLSSNGSFTYLPNANFIGTDSLKYQILNNGNISEKGLVEFKISGIPSGLDEVIIYSSNSQANYYYRSNVIVSSIEIYNSNGVIINTSNENASDGTINTSSLATGYYFVKFNIGGKSIIHKIVIQK